jgi:hypothetical protein
LGGCSCILNSAKWKFFQSAGGYFVVPSQQGNAGNRLVLAEHRYDTHRSVTDVRVDSGAEYRRQGQLRLAQCGTLRLSVIDLLRVTQPFGAFY